MLLVESDPDEILGSRFSGGSLLGVTDPVSFFELPITPTFQKSVAACC